MKKIIAVFGTRPEAIKMAPLIKELETRENIDMKVCVTGQHREMLEQVMNQFDIKTDYNLDIMKEKQTLLTISTSVLNGISEVLRKEKPDMILVHGDTTTTFVGALSGFYEKVKIGHVEAGLRSFDKNFPFPEEMNRKLTSGLADLHFAPTKTSKSNLLREGVNSKDIYVTGNTVIDTMGHTVKDDYIFENEKLNNIDFESKKIIMVTAHRRENWGKGIENICNGIKEIVRKNKDVEVVYLVHLNPIVRNVVEEILGKEKQVHLLEPLNTNDTHNLMNKSYMIMTDSGGIQEEAPHLGRPVLVLREITERPEAVEYGAVKLVGTNEKKIILEANDLLNNEKSYKLMSTAVNPYGDGEASRRIADIIENHFGIRNIEVEEFKN